MASKEKTQSKQKDDEPIELELSEEDRILKEKLDLLVESTRSNADLKTVQEALESLGVSLREATNSLTSIPKPLKFLRPHFETIKQNYESQSNPNTKGDFAILLSVLSMALLSEEGSVLEYRFEAMKLGQSLKDVELEDWGQEYVRHLTADMIEMYKKITTKQGERTDEESESLVNIKKVAAKVLGFYLSHSGEVEACDFMMELESLDDLLEYVTKSNCKKIAEYLIAASAYLPVPEDSHALTICYKIFMTHSHYVEALRMAVKLDSSDRVKSVFLATEDVMMRKQLAYYLTWCQYPLPFDDDEQDELWGDDDFDEFEEILSNKKMHETYISLATELDVMTAKTPDEVYKEHLVNIRSNDNVVSARKNLASTYVNAFVNMGYASDKLMTSTDDPDSGSWIYQNKEAGQLAAAASLGLIHFWSPDAINKLMPYVTSDNNFIKAGAFLGQGISAAAYDENIIIELLKEHLDKPDLSIRVATILGMAFATCGKQSEDLFDEVSGHCSVDQPPIVRAISALALGMCYMGSANDEVFSTICEVLMETVVDETMVAELEDGSWGCFYALAIGLLYYQCSDDDQHETCIEVVTAMLNEQAPKTLRQISTMVEACAYAGSGNVMQIQKLLGICGEHPEVPEKKNDEDEEEKEEEEKDDKPAEMVYHQAIAALGLAIVAMGEDYGNNMLLRAMNHLVQYAEPCVKRAVPMCLSLAYVSNPEIQITDLLSKLSHDADQDTVSSAILALGIVSAGTNNSRISQMLRSLMEYHKDQADQLYLIRISLGLLHMGKGLVTLSPRHSDNLLISKQGVAGLLTFLVVSMDLKSYLLGQYHYLIYSLVTAVRPRMLMTLDGDGELEAKKIDIRVGQSVDVVGKAGNPKRIAGFQTHETPIILGEGQRAELTSDKYISQTPILEGFVIVKENPNWEENAS